MMPGNAQKRKTGKEGEGTKKSEQGGATQTCANKGTGERDKLDGKKKARKIDDDNMYLTEEQMQELIMSMGCEKEDKTKGSGQHWKQKHKEWATMENTFKLEVAVAVEKGPRLTQKRHDLKTRDMSSLRQGVRKSSQGKQQISLMEKTTLFRKG